MQYRTEEKIVNDPMKRRSIGYWIGILVGI